MKKIFVLLITLLFPGLFHNHVSAQATRTWVSGVGDDTKPCSRTEPCKTFAGAINKTAAGGEINIIDAGAYGTINITKSITIDGRGLQAGILASVNTGITINAAATDVVILRNLDINGGTPTTPGYFGIKYLSAKKVYIEDCYINNFGYPNEPTGSIWVNVAGKAELSIKNTTITSFSTTVPGLYIRTSSESDTAVAVLNNVSIQGIGTAIHAGERAVVNVRNCELSDNSRAVYSEFASSLIRLSNTSIFNNTVGIGAGAGKVVSFGNNQIAGNLQDVPVTTVFSQQ